MSNTEKLLKGYELQNINQFEDKPKPESSGPKAHNQPELAEGESYTVSEKPDKFVCTIFNSLHFFEKRNSAVVGKIYILVTTFLLTLLFWMKQQFLPQLPAIEVLFVVFLTTFIFNYYLLNGALYKPFLDNTENSSLIKWCGGYAVAAIVAFFYGLKFINFQIALTVFYSAFFLVVVLEILVLNQTYKRNEILFALGALIGVILTISNSSGTFWDQVTVANGEGNALYGLILSGISAVLMALIMLNFGKMSSENFASMNHIFSMIIVLFTPIFFPIQGVVTPTLNQWIILIVMGLLTALASLLFIRSFQLEVGGRAAVFVLLQIAFVFVIELIVSKASGALGLVGAVVTIGCVGLYSKENPKNESVDAVIGEDKEIKMQEMVNLH